MARGFVIDSPQLAVISKDALMNVCTAKSGEIKINGESISINGGWSFYELAKIDTKKKIEINLKDSEWKMNSMVLATGGKISKGKSVRYYIDKKYTVATNAITIPFVVKAGTLKIEGLKETSELEPKTGEFKMAISESTTTVTLFTGEFVDGVEINPIFGVETESETLSVKTTDTPKGGTTILQYPVYGKKSDDYTNQTVIGYIQWTVFKTIIESDLNMGGSYKSAQEFDTKITGLDPERADEKMFDVTFFEVN